MKKIFLIFTILSFSMDSFGQDPELFRTWKLVKKVYHLSSVTLDVIDIDPSISPYLTIYTSLEFYGFGACNSFSGNFTYESPGYLDVVNCDVTDEICLYQSHQDFEEEYFIAFSNPYNVLTNYEIHTNPEGIKYLHIGPGIIGNNHYLVFIEGQNLSTSQNTRSPFYIFPNPASSRINIISENTKPEKMVIYSASGKVMQKLGFESSLDITSLPKGIYFLEITSQRGRSIHKIIKQ